MTKQDIEYNKNLEKLDNKTTKLEKAIAHIEYLENVLSCIDYEVFLFQRGRQAAEETLDEIHKLAEEAQDIDWERENV